MRERIVAYFDTLAGAIRGTAVTDLSGQDIGLERGFEIVRSLAHKSHDRGNKLIFIGNGGSQGGRFLQLLRRQLELSPGEPPIELPRQSLKICASRPIKKPTLDNDRCAYQRESAQEPENPRSAGLEEDFLDRINCAC